MERVTINGTNAQFSCKQNASKDLWDVKDNRMEGKSREAMAVNYTLDHIKAQKKKTTSSLLQGTRKYIKIAPYEFLSKNGIAICN